MGKVFKPLGILARWRKVLLGEVSGITLELHAPLRARQPGTYPYQKAAIDALGIFAYDEATQHRPGAWR